MGGEGKMRVGEWKMGDADIERRINFLFYHFINFFNMLFIEAPQKTTP